MVEWAEFQDASEGQTRATDGRYQNVVNERDLEKILGVPWWNGDEMEREERRGLVYGLVVSGLGEGGQFLRITSTSSHWAHEMRRHTPRRDNSGSGDGKAHTDWFSRRRQLLSHSV